MPAAASECAFADVDRKRRAVVHAAQRVLLPRWTFRIRLYDRCSEASCASAAGVAVV